MTIVFFPYILLLATMLQKAMTMTMTMTMTLFYSTLEIQIEIILYNSLENQIINWPGYYY